MASGFKVGTVDLDTFFRWNSAGAQSNDSTLFYILALDLSKFLYNRSVSETFVASGYLKGATDLSSLYCRTGCNSVCSGCTSCTGTCNDMCTAHCREDNN